MKDVKIMLANAARSAIQHAILHEKQPSTPPGCLGFIIYQPKRPYSEIGNVQEESNEIPIH